MKKPVILAIAVVAAVAGGAFYYGVFSRPVTSEATTAAQGGRAGGEGPAGRQGGGGGRGRGPAGPMTVEVATVSRAPIAQQLTVVGNLIGDATVAVVPKTAGRLQDVSVRLGDHVTLGQRIAKIEDQEIQEQVKQAEAAYQVASATIRQREADLQLALTNVERSRNLFQRQLLPRQTLDDNESRYQSAVAQLDLARAQNTQSQARLDELRITLANTVIMSPVEGFVARRAADPGAYVSNNAPVVDVVDIRRVRLVVNVIEKDLRDVGEGDKASVEVDAYPGETFSGRIARVAPVLDPSTRTAPIEIEIPNRDYRLKPGMYARVRITTGEQKNAVVVPANAVIDVNGRRGVFLPENNIAMFRPVQVGIEESTRVEILDGVSEGDSVITTGAAGLTNGARFIIAGGRGDRGGGRAAGGDAADSDRTQTRTPGAGTHARPSAEGTSSSGSGGESPPVVRPGGGREGGRGHSRGQANGEGGRNGGSREGRAGQPDSSQ